MSTTLDPQLWDSPPKITIAFKRLSTKETTDLDDDRSESVMTLRRDSETICNGSESSVETKFDSCKCNNNTSACDFEVKNGESKVRCACFEENVEMDGNFSAKKEKSLRRRLKKRESLRKESEDEICQPLTGINVGNKSCGISSEHGSGSVGGDGEEVGIERSRCRQHELSLSSNEINRRDVTASCDLTSNSAIKFKSDCREEEIDQNHGGKKDCPGTRTSSSFQSTCSEGSYSRRRHHKHHKHKQKSRSPVRSDESPSISPKVNPIFLWVRQEDTRIVEVLCEDYDHRNRLRLTRTQRGWRAIPKTKLFAEAIIPKAAEKEKEESSAKPKRLKKLKKRKKDKKRGSKTFLLDNPNQIKECSVALCRDDLSNYKNRALILNSGEEESREEVAEVSPRPNSDLEKPSTSDWTESQCLSPSSSRESLPDFAESLSQTKKLIKSNSCDFSSGKKASEGLTRSISLDLKLKRDNVDFKVQKKMCDLVEVDNPMEESENVVDVVKCEPCFEKTDEEPTESVQVTPLSDAEPEDAPSQRNHSDTLVDMTKRDSDFNDADCDELGQLLKDIPDLEFVEEEELEEVDEEEEEEGEEEEWSTPTDLTLPKSTIKVPEIKLPSLPAKITPVVTLTSSVKPPEPLTAPLPEVTITPIPKPKPAHQQKPQNNFLESLLSIPHSVKPESEETSLSHKKERRSVELPQCERKATKHFYEHEPESEVKSKKLKMEDITLKNLLSRHQSGRTVKSVDIEACVQKLKTTEGEECTKSRLQELLTDKVSSDPISQLKEVLSNPHLAVPDPLLVPRARLPALVASPASEIPRLLSMHLEKTIEETPCPPITDSDVLEVSLSNLRSLLSCSPEKLKGANTQDLANYQKSLETFLEWQRYQTEIMEAQMKSSKSLPSGFHGDIADVAAATALSQMLWLPYLNQLDFGCGPNRDIMSFVNGMLASEYQANAGNLSAPPQINISQVPQPSPFLTPTSPMDIESHLKTLAMWQEALAMQQNSHSSRTCTKASHPPTNQQDLRTGPKFPNVHYPPSQKKQNFGPHSHGRRGSAVPPVSSRADALHNGYFNVEFHQDLHNDYHRTQSRPNSFRQRLEEQQRQLELHQKYSQESQHQFRKMQRSYSNPQTEYKACRSNERKRTGTAPGSISVKPLSNLVDKANLPPAQSKSSWEPFEEDFTSQVASKLLQFNTQIQRTRGGQEKPFDWHSQGLKAKSHSGKQNPPEAKRGGLDTPKLKVKNLVDPSMSPPKLLKQIAPEHLPLEDRGPMQEDPQANLWHPLFGSNQIKPSPYNSPWRWTTVTVNGE